MLVPAQAAAGGQVNTVSDAVRAWRSYDGFEGRSSLRVWLYRIATNACLTAVRQRGRRPLPSGLGAPSDDPDGPTPEAPGVPWLQPVADALVTPESDDPAVVAATRDGVRLALVAGLQELPPRQRAVLLLGRRSRTVSRPPRPTWAARTAGTLRSGSGS